MAHGHNAPEEFEHRTSPAMRARLSAMMFIQYWPLGIWGVTVGTYIAANTGEEGGRIFSAGFVGYSTAAGALGCLVAPVFIGYLSDRYFSATRLLALMHLGCAAAAWGMFETRNQTVFFLCLLAYFNFFAPAAALTNKISLRHLINADTEYPRLRIFGTAGWITAGLFLGYVWPALTGETIESTRTPLLLGALGSVMMSFYALTLPHTPPEVRNESAARLGLHDRTALLRNRPLVLFLIVSMLACAPSMAYNNYGNWFLNSQSYSRPAALMTLGQVSDLVFLWAAPWLIARFGLKILFVAGVFAWSVRYALLAAGSHFLVGWPVIVAILIHGPCFVFIYVIGVMYVDHLADATHRGAAQGMYAFATTGAGHLLGALMVGYTQEVFLTPEGVSPPPYHWTAFWAVPAMFSLVTVLLFKISLTTAKRRLV